MLDATVLEEEGLYEVDRILASRRRKNKTMYLVKGKGWDVSESTWECMANLKTAKHCIKEFEESHKTRK